MGIQNGMKRVGRSFSSFTNRVYRTVAAGPLGRIFGSYHRADAYFQNTALMRALRPKANKKQGNTARRMMASAMDQSLLRRAAYGVLNGLCCCSLRTLGVFFAVASCYSVAISWLISVLWQQGTLDGFHVFLALGIFAFGVILMFSKNSVAYALEKGRLTGGILHRLLGVSADYVKQIPAQGVQMYAVAVPFGMLVGTVVALTGPLYPALALLFASLMLLMLTTPEAGILLLLLATPFVGFLPYSYLWLVLGVVLSCFGYLFKVMRGTRAFRMEIQDFTVLAILVLTLLGAASAAAEPLLGVCLSALMILVYFPAVNILATPNWLKRCHVGLMLSATATALVGILQFLIKLFSSRFPISSFDELGAAVRAGFSTNIIFAYFMVLAFPFALYAFMHVRTAARRISVGFACVSILAAAILTWVQPAWIALVLEIVVLLLLCKRQSFVYIMLGILLIPVTLLALPQPYRAAFLEFMGANAPVSGTAMAKQVFFGGGEDFFGYGAGVARMLFGLGFGGMERVGVLYAFPSSYEGVSFWWARWFESGILGVFLSGALFFLLLQNCFSLLAGSSRVRTNVAPPAGISMTLGALLLSCFTDTWGDPTAMLPFFVLIAIIAADARNRRSVQTSLHTGVQSPSRVEVEYRAKEVRGKRKKQEGEMSGHE